MWRMRLSSDKYSCLAFCLFDLVYSKNLMSFASRISQQFSQSPLGAGLYKTGFPPKKESFDLVRSFFLKKEFWPKKINNAKFYLKSAFVWTFPPKLTDILKHFHSRNVFKATFPQISLAGGSETYLRWKNQ